MDSGFRRNDGKSAPIPACAEMTTEGLRREDEAKSQTDPGIRRNDTHTGFPPTPE
jgi:hypothetical protein